MSIQARYAVFGAVLAVTLGLVAYLYVTGDRSASLESAAVLAGGLLLAAASSKGGRCGWSCRRRREPDGV
jgi:hypothetical protein